MQEFIRMSGARNSFLIAPKVYPQAPSVTQDFIRRNCSKFGGSDGLIFLRAEPGFDFSWEFYNRDGSRAEMCGNAARCVATLYFDHLAPQKTELVFLTLAGPIFAKKMGPQVLVKMPLISRPPQQLRVLLRRGVEMNGYFVDSGVPHFVLFEKPDRELAIEIQNHEQFFPKKTNVTFVEKENVENSLVAVTFERGVFDFTPACGTGAVAAVATSSIENPKTQPHSHWKVKMPGGDLSLITVDEVQPPQVQFWLSGRVSFDFSTFLPKKGSEYV